MTESIIHLRVPAAVKARWVRESRAARMKLADWIVSRVERPMSIPEIIAEVAVPAEQAADGGAGVAGAGKFVVHILMDGKDNEKMG